MATFSVNSSSPAAQTIGSSEQPTWTTDSSSTQAAMEAVDLVGMSDSPVTGQASPAPTIEQIDSSHRLETRHCRRVGRHCSLHSGQRLRARNCTLLKVLNLPLNFEQCLNGLLR